MTLSRKDLEKILCIACGKAFGDHSRSGLSTKFSIRSLMECMLRIQGTLVSNGIQNNSITTPSTTADNNTLSTVNMDIAENTMIDDVEWIESDGGGVEK